MQGEIQAKQRPMNSLLGEVLDFPLGNKLPPTITKEATDNLEATIKQRILDELFDDPVRKHAESKKEGGDDFFDFTKSKKGLGEIYEEDFKKKLLDQDPNAYLANDLTGTDSGLKKEVDSIITNLFYQLDCLSNFNFTPKPPG